MHGFLLIDKPVDWTSHDVVGYLRGVTKIRKIGHAGTLDPFATGLLIVGVGRECTKRLDEFKDMKKEYVATIRLGATSDTRDRTGEITRHEIPTGHSSSGTRNTRQITEQEISAVLQGFLGKQMQVPPMYSAKKVGGKKLYELARKGIEIEREANEIEVFDIMLSNTPVIARSAATSQSHESDTNDEIATSSLRTPRNDSNIITLRISCSTGTYIRTLAHDIGQAFGTGAYCEELRRTKIGEYSVEDAIEPKEIEVKVLPTLLFQIP